MRPMDETNDLLRRASTAKTDSEAVAVLTSLVHARDAINGNATVRAAPLQAQREELDQKLAKIWDESWRAQAQLEAAIKRLGAMIAGPRAARKYSMPRTKPVSEARILGFFHGTNVLWRPNEIAQGLGIESTPAFRKMLRAMAEDGALDQYGERGGSKYCAKGASLN